MYWPNEKSVTTVADKFIVPVKASDNVVPVVGRTVRVKKFGRIHEGIVAAIGKQILKSICS